MARRHYDTVRVGDVEFTSFSRPEIHVRLAEILDSMPRGRLLDMPTGTGALAHRLSGLGFDVVGCDLEPEKFQAPGLSVVAGNLNGRFPFEDGSFDYACFIEGPEHVQNPLHALQEFGRVIRPGGRLILSLPNYTNIEQRLRILLLGSSEKAVSRRRFQERYDGELAMVHVSPILFTQLRFLLEQSGFVVRGIERDRVKRKQILLWPLVGLIQLLSLAQGRRGREMYFIDQANSTRILMGGNTLIVIAERLDDTAASASSPDPGSGMNSTDAATPSGDAP